METPNETRPLLNGGRQTPQYTGRRCVPIEFVGFLYFIATVFAVPTTQFYILDWVEKQHGHDMNKTSPKGGSQCTPHNTSEADGTIQGEKAQYLMYSSFLSCFPAFIPVLFLGLCMDKYGRKRPLLYTLSGAVIRDIIYVVVMKTKLRVEFLFIGNVIEGITGYFGAALMGVFSIISDVTAPGKSRAFRIAFAEATYTIGASIGQFSSGYWIKDNTNYDNAMIVSTCLNVAALLFLLIVIPETHLHRMYQENIISLKTVKRTFKFYVTETETKRRTKMQLVFVAFFLGVSVHMSVPALIVLFLQDTPLCWSEFHITTYLALLIGGQWVVILIVTKVLQKVFKIQDVTVAIIGTISGVAFLSVIPAATSTGEWIMYLAAGLGCYYLVPASMARSIMSRHAESHEQGSLFAGVACVEMLLTAVAGITFTQIYRDTLHFYRGIVFWVLAAVLFATLITFTILRHKLKTSAAVRRSPVDEFPRATE